MNSLKLAILKHAHSLGDKRDINQEENIEISWNIAGDLILKDIKFDKFQDFKIIEESLIDREHYPAFIQSLRKIGDCFLYQTRMEGQMANTTQQSLTEAVKHSRDLRAASSSRPFMCRRSSDLVHGPPVRMSKQTAPQPVRDASQARRKSGREMRMALPDGKSASVNHHERSDRASCVRLTIRSRSSLGKEL